MKRSIGAACHPARRAAGNVGASSGAACRAGGANDQCDARAVAIRSAISLARLGGGVLSSPPGPLHGAPAATHDSSTEISSSLSRPVGGMPTSSACRTTAMSRLFAVSPGTTTGPVSLPWRSARRLSSRRPASATFSPWHSWHFATSSGRTRDSKSRAASDRATPEAKDAVAAARRRRWGRAARMEAAPVSALRRWVVGDIGLEPMTPSLSS